MTNNIIIDELNKMIIAVNKEMKETKNKTLGFKIRSYRKTIGIIKTLDYTIVSSSQLKDIKGFGLGTLKKIDEIIETGKLEKTKNIDNKDLNNSKNINDLQKITGIGPSKAQKLFSENITLDRLIKIDFDNLNEDDETILSNLTNHQKLGVKYYHHLEKRIPYNEISKMELYINKIIKKIDSKLNIVICGSYRRKQNDSGDIDVLIYHTNLKKKGEIEKSLYLSSILQIFINDNFIVDSLTSINKPSKYMGFCKLKFHKFIRRIDIRIVPYDSLASSLLYFTGSGEFNKNMRTYALSKGVRLNEYGIYRLINKVKTFKIKAKEEKDIFRILNLEYVAPESRLPSYKFI